MVFLVKVNINTKLFFFMFPIFVFFFSHSFIMNNLFVFSLLVPFTFSCVVYSARRTNNDVVCLVRNQWLMNTNIAFSLLSRSSDDLFNVIFSLRVC